ncbi:MAG: Bug family tripartite tricarboxylate transporter substrate binding protein [Xanthobacteraceae bacterium]
MRKSLSVSAIPLVAALLFSGSAASQLASFRIIVPYPPASGPDILSRLMADQIGRGPQGPTVVVENRPGGGTTIGTEAAARSPADGSTVLLVANSFVVNPALKKTGYDVSGSFEPVCYLAATPIVLVVAGSSPYRSLEDLLAAARSKPGEITVAGAPASSLQIAYEVLKRSAQVNMTYVPFPGSAPAVNALLGGHVSAVSADYPTVVPHLKSGTLRALVTGGKTRVDALPDVPTFAETGLGNYQDEIFYGMVAPAKTPAPVLAQLSAAFSTALKAPETRPKLSQQGLFPVDLCGTAFGDYLREKVEQYGRIVAEANIKAE